MRIHKRAVTVAVAGAVSLAGLGVVAATNPVSAVAAGVAETDSGSGSPTFGDRLSAIKDALKGLVSDGTITQEQADQVATALNDSGALRHGGPGGPGPFGFHGGFGLDVVADALGLTQQELRAALGEGKTLAEIAEAEGVETEALVDDLVAAATERIEQAVTAERLSRERADELIAELPERIATVVEEGVPGGLHHLRHHRQHRHLGDRDGSVPGPTEDEPQQTPQESSTTSGASLAA